MLEVNVQLSFADFTLEIAQDFPLSGVTAIFGRSGSGKSTLLRVIAGFETRAQGRIAMSGEVWQDGKQQLPPERRGVGFVFQDTRLFPHLSVRGNLEFALKRAHGLGGPKLDDVVGALDLGPLLARRPVALSGGERQRVAMGRAILAAPKILLMDEPLASLDDGRKAEILPYIEALRDETGLPILYVSHSLPEVARLATTIAVIAAGKVVAVGPAADILSDPATAQLMGLRDAGAVLTARIAAHEADGLTRLETEAGPLWLPHVAGAPGRSVRVRIAAQDVILSRDRPVGLSALNILPAKVAALHDGQGPGVLVRLEVGSEFLLARLTRRSAQTLGLAPGVAVHAVLKSVAVAQADVGGVTRAL